MSETSSTVDTEEYGYEDEIREFLKLAEESKVNLEAWKKASLSTRSNRELLREEMQTTIDEVREFVKQMEEQAKMRKFRRRTYGNGEWTKLVAKEKYFMDAIHIGEEVMKKLIDALTVFPEPIIPEPLHSLTDIHAMIQNEKDSTRKIALEGYELITRFAKLLDGEGITHNYPVSKAPEKLKLFRRVITDEEPETTTERSSRKAHQVKSIDSKHTSIVGGSQFEDATSSPGAFLRDYAGRNEMEPIYKEISAVKTVWQQEYISTCKLGKIVGEGKSKRRSVSKQIAAAHVLRQILSKTKRNSLPEDMTPLTESEMKDVLNLTCEFIEYGSELQAICSQENARPPIYTPLLTKPASASTPHVEMRCKALGFNAVGYGRDREIAKRMAAKLVLDQLTDDREKSIGKGPTTKLDWSI
ncbi:hypothetical protein GE061_017919 [Apolygus lucorum]|uniref:DRBM domain-containing protein n=1 Tax=Apolygus lucorum TaxID=248454 RepID=A0A8S9XCH8_APOLU|nr:hypothetical protein GE061_017919 [Apolygus lucorum]